MKFILISFILMMLPNLLAQSVLTWELFHPIKKVWIGAGTNQSVQEVLIATEVLPYTFLGQEDTKLLDYYQ
jgi:hypothetical protein